MKVMKMRHPSFLHTLPENVQAVAALATDEEIAEANQIRSGFILPEGSSEYMVDIVRAFRLAHGARHYIEVGTRDKGNIAWLSGKLDPHAVIIDIDIEQVIPAQQRVRDVIGEKQNIHFIEGDCLAPAVIRQAEAALAGKLADVIFLDSSHLYSHFMAEIDIYWGLLRPGGVMLVHDVYWEGNELEKGKAQAFDQIDKHIPVWVVYMNEKIGRFFRPHWKATPVWGGVGIIVKPEIPA